MSFGLSVCKGVFGVTSCKGLSVLCVAVGVQRFLNLDYVAVSVQNGLHP